MLAALKQLFTPSALKESAYAVYSALVAQARDAKLYAQYGVADTLDGRFDAIVLHLFMVQEALKAEGSQEALQLSRYLCEAFIDDMDRSLREMGVSDTGVGKRVKKMAAALLGRVSAYSESYSDQAAFKLALLRNLYRGDIAKEAVAAKLADYVRHAMQALKNTPYETLKRGEIAFPPL